MRIGASLFLIAVGAILKWAVTERVEGINLEVVGVILMIVGLAGLVFEFFWWASHRRSTVVTRPAATTYVEPGAPVDRVY